MLFAGYRNILYLHNYVSSACRYCDLCNVYKRKHVNETFILVLLQRQMSANNKSTILFDKYPRIFMSTISRTRRNVET